MDSIDCEELIDTFTELADADRQAMKDEIVFPSLCPNTTSITLEGNSISGFANFELNLVPFNLSSTGVVDNSMVISSVISRYFEAEEYVEQGYMTPITMSVTETYTSS